MKKPIRSGRWYQTELTFRCGDGTEYEVKLAPISHLTTDLHKLKPRGWFARWWAGCKGAWK